MTAAVDLPFPDDGEAPFCISLGLSTCLSLIRFLNALLLAEVKYADVYLFGAVLALASFAVA